jgi:hypothetical protein
MAEKYFSKFPKIQYSNNIVVDITRRVTLTNKFGNNPYSFYPYDITDEERPDQFSNRYYNDQYQSWLLYITNQITDPYYGWYLTQTQFDEFIEKKYGSIYTAQQKIKYYKNNWENVENISVAEYNALTDARKYYWDPVYADGYNISSYKRKNFDFTTTTNKVICYSVSNTSFALDEICKVVYDSNYVGYGQVAASANNKLYLQHVSGTYYSNVTGICYIYGTESKVNTVFTSVNSVSNSTGSTDNISEDELIYWTPVTYYDYEYNKNEYNKSIKVMDSKYAQQASDNLKNLFKNK